MRYLAKLPVFGTFCDNEPLLVLDISFNKIEGSSLANLLAHCRITQLVISGTVTAHVESELARVCQI